MSDEEWTGNPGSGLLGDGWSMDWGGVEGEEYLSVLCVREQGW